jgi:formamidopyrimidine-DNA glycosylase
MPELPDVEGFRRTLAACGQGRRIRDVRVADAGVLHGVSGRQLQRDLEGCRLAEPERYGKWLLAHTDGPTVLFHFGMTGGLLCCSRTDPPHPHDRVVFEVDDRQLRYRDQRKLQGIWLGDDAVAKVLSEQGPDALGLGRAEFVQLLSGRRGTIKAAIIDQSVIAGLGNLLSDEILWRAELHPRRRVAGLGSEEVRRLHTEMGRVLRSSVRAGCVPPRASWLTGHRDDPDPRCPRCDGPLRRGRTAGRTGVWCPRCQPEGD